MLVHRRVTLQHFARFPHPFSAWQRFPPISKKLPNLFPLLQQSVRKLFALSLFYLFISLANVRVFKWKETGNLSQFLTMFYNYVYQHWLVFLATGTQTACTALSAGHSNLAENINRAPLSTNRQRKRQPVQDTGVLARSPQRFFTVITLYFDSYSSHQRIKKI